MKKKIVTSGSRRLIVIMIIMFDQASRSILYPIKREIDRGPLLYRLIVGERPLLLTGTKTMW